MPLTPSQRVTLITEIAQRLQAEEWPLIDLTLSQFSMPTNVEWNENKNSYVLSMIENAPDAGLIELGQHVGFDFEQAPSPGIDPPFWMKGMLRVFVTHLAAHRAFAGQLQTSLLPFGITSFVAHNDIEPTSEWQTQIETALATCDALVALLNPEFHASNWTDQEIGFAMGRGLPIFSVHFGQDPYGFIGRFQAFNGIGKDASTLAKELFDAYRKHKQTQHRMSEVSIGLFEASVSFAEAKERIGYIEQIETWQPSFSTRISSAAKNNSQIADAWGVPARVDALIEKWGQG